MTNFNSPSTGSGFLMPLYNDLVIRLIYNNVRHTVDRKSRNTSVPLGGFGVKVYENNGGLYLNVGYIGELNTDSMEMKLSRVLTEGHPCAFRDPSSGELTNFTLPAGTESITLGVRDGILTVTPKQSSETYRPSGDTSPDYTDARPRTPAGGTRPSFGSRPTGGSHPTDGEPSNDPRPTGGTRPVGDSFAYAVELERLRELIPQLIDTNYKGDYVKTRNPEIDALTDELKRRKAESASTAARVESLKRDLGVAEAENARVERELADVKRKLESARGIKAERESEATDKSARLKALLGELNMSEAALGAYERADGITSFAEEVRVLKSKIGETLKASVDKKQRDCNDRFGKVNP